MCSIKRIGEYNIMEDNYKKLCAEYSQKVKYPEYGEWCKDTILNIIKEYGVSDSMEYLTTKVFNPDSDLYEFLDGNNPEYVLGWINYKPHYKESLFDIIYNRFYNTYANRYEAMNKELADMEYESCTGKDILTDIIGNADNSNVELMNKALNEIGVNGFKEYILRLLQRQ